MLFSDSGPMGGRRKFQHVLALLLLFIFAINYGFTRVFPLIVHLDASENQISTPPICTLLHVDSGNKKKAKAKNEILLFYASSVNGILAAICYGGIHKLRRLIFTIFLNTFPSLP